MEVSFRPYDVTAIFLEHFLLHQIQIAVRLCCRGEDRIDGYRRLTMSNTFWIAVEGSKPALSPLAPLRFSRLEYGPDSAELMYSSSARSKTRARTDELRIGAS